MTTQRRHERTLRAIIWLDLFLSVTFVALCVVASPLVAVLGIPPAGRTALAIGLFVCAGLLGGFGGVAAVLMMRRMVDGDFHVPSGQRYPLPAGMRPQSR